MSEFNIRKFDPSAQPGFEKAVTFCLPDQPLVVEIGCGVGLHPIKYSKLNKNFQIVAIEHTRNKFATFKNALRAEDVPIENLLAVHANAITWVSKFLPPESVDEYFLLYPNPWPKERQKNQRWHQMPFMDYLLTTLKYSGKLTIATNLQFYAEEAEYFLVNFWKLKLIEKSNVANLMTNDQNYFPRTHFEKKYLSRGENCTNLVFQKL